MAGADIAIDVIAENQWGRKSMENQWGQTPLICQFGKLN